jgi:hypothetical protein
MALRRDLAAVRFNDGMGNAQSHAHAVLLVVKKGSNSRSSQSNEISGPVSRIEMTASPSDAHDLQAISRGPTIRPVWTGRVCPRSTGLMHEARDGLPRSIAC